MISRDLEQVFRESNREWLRGFMNTLRGWLLRLGEFFGRERRERELAAEMESHLQMHTDENLRAGMSALEARRQALIKLGGIEQTKEMVRERHGLPMLEVLLQDLRFAGRTLRRNPGFTSVAVLTLALGVGANTALFSVVKAVLLNSLPYRQPERLITLVRGDSQTPNPTNVSYGETEDWKARTRSFQILRQVVGEGMKLAAIGAAIGIVVALPLPRVLESLLQSFQVSGTWVYLLIPAVISVVALLACYGPARRAARVDPMVALRYE